MMPDAGKEHSVEPRQSTLVADKPTDIAAGRVARVGCAFSCGAAQKDLDAGDADRVFAELGGVAIALGNKKPLPGSGRN